MPLNSWLAHEITKRNVRLAFWNIRDSFLVAESSTCAHVIQDTWRVFVALSRAARYEHRQ